LAPKYTFPKPPLVIGLIKTKSLTVGKFAWGGERSEIEDFEVEERE